MPTQLVRRAFGFVGGFLDWFPIGSLIGREECRIRLLAVLILLPIDLRHLAEEQILRLC